MKNNLLILMGETLVLGLIAFAALWDPFLTGENGIWIFVITYIILIAIIGVQGYFFIIKPYSVKIRQMEEAIEESAKAEQIRREFVANVSHELKTPLTSISGFIETLQSGAVKDPEVSSHFIDIIAIETARLKRLIEDLLVLSDIENKRDSDGAEFDVKQAIESTAETLRIIAEEKNIDIILQLESGITLKGSSDRFRQMLVNLIENGIKYSEPDSRVWVKAIRETNGKILVSVADEGIGIAPEHHERLFERFYRVDKSRSKKVGGTGLGLSIVKHIAVLFGATLSVSSQPGKGTTFFIEFEREEEVIGS